MRRGNDTQATPTQATTAWSHGTGDGNVPSRAGWATLMIVLCATFVTTLDFFIVNVAVPSMTSSLHADPAQVQWIIAGFAVAIACGVITAGRMGDLYGRRRLFVIGLVAFVVTSAACGLSPNADLLVASSVFQGVAAAVMAPQVLAIIAATYTGRDRVHAFTGYGLALGVAAVFGQLIGGVLIQADLFGWGWRSCFLVNIPLGVVAVAFAMRVIREGRPVLVSTEQRSHLDFAGVAVIAVALFALVLPLINGRQAGWPTWTWISLTVSGALLWSFVLLMRRKAALGRTPLVDPVLFADRAFTSGSVALLFSWIGQASFFLVLAIYLQDGLEFTAIGSGEVFATLGAAYLIALLLSPTVGRRLGKQTIAAGAALMAIGLAVLLWSTHTAPFPLLFVGLAIDGAGMGFVLAPMVSLVLAEVEPHVLGSASGVFSAINQVGGALGVTLVGIVFYGTSNVATGFEHSLELLAAFAVAVVFSIQFLPHSKRGVSA
ncbi:MFS transporter [Rathayibacter soli]|uniref:MFS transporter n=1 Tax=Rathayibacter soli TaxID=3144168 RepID=UPI0027E58C1C|nr:MFS transporter [Glaciibacter superstes]